MERRYKILLADDEEGWRELVGLWLQNAGYDVEILAQGKGVLELARRYRPDCFILDYDLGDTTGQALCEEIKSAPELTKTPVIILTANVAALPAVIGNAPPDQFIAKSGHPDELLLILEGLLPNRNQFSNPAN